MMKNTTVPLNSHQAAIESPQFLGYRSYNPQEDIFRIGKRIDENLEDLYDRLTSNHTKISTKLRVYSVSEHLEFVAQQRASDVLDEMELEDERRSSSSQNEY